MWLGRVKSLELEVLLRSWWNTSTRCLHSRLPSLFQYHLNFPCILILPLDSLRISGLCKGTAENEIKNNSRQTTTKQEKKRKPDCIIMTNQDSCGSSLSVLSVFPFLLFQSQDNNSAITNHHLICTLPNWKQPSPKRPRICWHRARLKWFHPSFLSFLPLLGAVVHFYLNLNLE